MDRKAYSVHQVNQYIKEILEDDILLNGIFVEAEVSNFKPHSSGHLYFTLKDQFAALNCVMFRNHAESINFLLENGMQVVVYGRISLYEKTGQYQLYVEFLEPLGKGKLYMAFEQTKNKLEREGLFDFKYKKEIPSFPKTIAVITSPTGAVIQDIMNVAARRNKNVELVVAPTTVQGQSAANEIAQAIRMVNKWGGADVIILARGGGSLEDLWPFNEELVARAIFNSKIPIVSAVGHETDYTIADFVSDLRAPTPSAAAELAVPALEELKQNLDITKIRMNNSISNKIEKNRQLLESHSKRATAKSFLEGIYNRQIYLEQLMKKVTREMNHQIQNNRLKINALAEKIEGRSPLAVLTRGYTLVYDENGNIKTSASSVENKESLSVRFHDGQINVIVKEGERIG